MSTRPQQIDLNTPLRLRSAMCFPLQHAQARREVIIGGLLLCIPVLGWILNMGHRIHMVHRMQQGQPAWPAWENPVQLLKDGSLTLLGMIEYHAPAILLACFAWQQHLPGLYPVAAALWILATIAVPGYMSHYCLQRDPSEIFNPAKALRRVFQAGPGYWHAWGIALSGLALSFLGLLGFGIGFFFSSVWFWQVAGFSFATQFTQSFSLQKQDESQVLS